MSLRCRMLALLVGVFCGMAWGGIAAARADATAAPARERSAESTSPVSDEADSSSRVVEALRQATFLLVVLVLVFAISLLAFRRWSKRYRARLLREPPETTDYTDVWAMHRLPGTDETLQDHGRDTSDDDRDDSSDDHFSDEGDESR